MKKVLYFEGAGWADADSSKKTNVGNCRIRTAFTNNNNQKIYLELMSYEKILNDVKKYPRFPEYEVGEVIGFIDSCHIITNDELHDDENDANLRIEHRNMTNIKYSLESILKYVNETCNCSFDEVKTLNDLGGYRVFNEKHTRDYKGYNYGDEFNYNAELEEKRKEIYKYFYELEQSEGKTYPNFSLWVDQNNENILHLLRHYNGYNKHWIIKANIENWIDTIEENKLGKYAC